MKAIKRVHGIDLALTATAIVGVLFAGLANAMADPEINKGESQRGIAVSGSGDQFARGPVGRLVSATDVASGEEAKLKGHLVSGPVGQIAQNRDAQ